MSTKTKKKTTSKKNEVPTEDEVVPMEVVDEEVPEVKIEDYPESVQQQLKSSEKPDLTNFSPLQSCHLQTLRNKPNLVKQ